MRPLLITFCTLFTFTFGYSQLQVNTTVNFFEFGEFNEVLAENQYPSFTNESLSIAVLSASYKNVDSKFGSRNGILLTFFDSDQRNVTNPMSVNTNRSVDLRSIAFLTGYEYTLIKNRIFTLAPSIDFILSQQRLILTSDFPSNPSFANLLASDAQVETLRNLRVMVDGRLNIMFHLGRKDSKAKFGLGITGGYRLDFSEPNWRYERVEDVEIPGSRQNGLELGILFTIKLPKFRPAGPNKKEQKS